jgi:hypothetical protein
MAELAEYRDPSRLHRRFWVGLVVSLAAVLLSLVALIVALLESHEAAHTAPVQGTVTSCDASAVARETMGSVVTLFVKGADEAIGNGSGAFCGC